MITYDDLVPTATFTGPTDIGTLRYALIVAYNQTVSEAIRTDINRFYHVLTGRSIAQKGGSKYSAWETQALLDRYEEPQKELT